jgi:ABC-type Fe3+-citrate transport system substrate-binding protein
MTTELPKVQGYVPQAAFDKLNEFKEIHKLKSLSVALTAVLEDYFGINHYFSAKSDLLTNQTELEKRVQNLEEQLEILTQTVAAFTTPVVIGESNGKSVENSDVESSMVEVLTPMPISESEVTESDSIGRLLTAKQLAKFLGDSITEKAVNGAAYKGNASFRQWSTKKGKGIWDFIAADSKAGRNVRLFFRIG